MSDDEFVENPPDELAKAVAMNRKILGLPPQAPPTQPSALSRFRCGYFHGESEPGMIVDNENGGYVLFEHAEDLRQALSQQAQVPEDLQQRIKEETKTTDDISTWPKAVAVLLDDSEVWSKHSLTELLHKAREQAQQLAASQARVRELEEVVWQKAQEFIKPIIENGMIRCTVKGEVLELCETAEIGTRHQLATLEATLAEREQRIAELELEIMP